MRTDEEGNDASGPTDASPPTENDTLPTGLPRGILVVPFIMTAGVTLLVGYALEQSISTTWVFIALLVGAVAAVSSISWSATHRPRSAAAAAHTAKPRQKTRRGKPHAQAEPNDPLGHIHAVEKQGRRHQRPCPNCGTPVSTKLEQCPNCDHKILVDCKNCRTRVRLEWSNCPECGRGLP